MESSFANEETLESKVKHEEEISPYMPFGRFERFKNWLKYNIGIAQKYNWAASAVIFGYADGLGPVWGNVARALAVGNIGFQTWYDRKEARMFRKRMPLSVVHEKMDIVDPREKFRQKREFQISPELAERLTVKKLGRVPYDFDYEKFSEPLVIEGEDDIFTRHPIEYHVYKTVVATINENLKGNEVRSFIHFNQSGGENGEDILAVSPFYVPGRVGVCKYFGKNRVQMSDSTRVPISFLVKENKEETALSKISLPHVKRSKELLKAGDEVTVHVVYKNLASPRRIKQKERYTVIGRVVLGQQERLDLSVPSYLDQNFVEPLGVFVNYESLLSEKETERRLIHKTLEMRLDEKTYAILTPLINRAPEPMVREIASNLLNIRPRVVAEKQKLEEQNESLEKRITELTDTLAKQREENRRLKRGYTNVTGELKKLSALARGITELEGEESE